MPPVLDAVNVPFVVAPLQVVIVSFGTVTFKAVGWLIVYEAVTEHPLTSVTVIVYVPPPIPERVSVVSESVLF